MQQSSVPLLVDIDPEADVTDLLWRHAEDTPDTVLFSRKIAGAWVNVTAAAFRDEVVAVARGLVASGVEPGDRVALMSRTRYEWTLFDFAIWAAGGVVVPVYETSAPEQVSWMLCDSGARAVVVETSTHHDLLDALGGDVSGIASVWVLDDGAVDTLVAAGVGVSADEIDVRRAALRADTVATLIYTSGTTGKPKGCELTHANFRHEVDNIVAGLSEVFEGDDVAALLFLPLAHVLARVVQLACVAGKVRLGHTSDVKNLMTDLADFRPTFLLTVPRVFEKVYSGAEQKAQAAGKGRVFAKAAEVAVTYSEVIGSSRRPSAWLRVKHAVLDRVVYARLRDAMGGRVVYAICGGAPLSERLAHFFRGIGLTVLEGYGLTETTAAATLNRPGNVKIGTVGQPVPGTTVVIDDDGEVLVKGGIVFAGYHGNPGATKEALDDDGWLSTGDRGRIDADGFLSITGRKKELIVTAGGKNVSPAGIEDRIRAHPLVSQCLVVGDGQPYVAALVTLDDEGVAAWLAGRGRGPLDVVAAAHDPEVAAEIQVAVDGANKALSRAEQVKRLRILDVDFTEDNGFMTPTMKVKRNVVLSSFADEVASLYT